MSIILAHYHYRTTDNVATNTWTCITCGKDFVNDHTYQTEYPPRECYSQNEVIRKAKQSSSIQAYPK